MDVTGWVRKQCSFDIKYDFGKKNFYPGSRKLPPPWLRNVGEEASPKSRVPVKPPEEMEEEDSQPKTLGGTSINSNRNG